MMKRLFILAWSLYSLYASAQNSFVNEHLMSAQNDSRLTRYAEELSFLEQDQIKTSWIREVEVRGRSDHFSEQLSEYRLRLSPSNPWEVKANKEYSKQLQQTTQINYQLALARVLKDRYEQLIESYFVDSRTQLLSQLLTIREVQNAQILEGTNGLNAEALLEAESEISDLEIDLAESKLELIETNQIIQNTTQSTVDWSAWLMIQPEQIMAFLDGRDTSNYTNPYIRSSEEKLALEEQMLTISKREAFSNIGFIQADMDLDQGNTLNDHLGFQVGISLPIVNRDKADLARNRFKLIEKRNDNSRLTEIMAQEIESQKNQIKALYELHRLIDSKINRAEDLAQNISTSANSNTIFKYRRYKLDLTWKSLDTHERLLSAFLDYLELEGLLAQRPLINFLSNNLEPIHQTNSK